MCRAGARGEVACGTSHSAEWKPYRRFPVAFCNFCYRLESFFFRRFLPLNQSGGYLMSKELFWLSLTLAMTALFFLPYVLNRIMVRGLWATMANPSPDDTPLSPWAQRAQRAH